MSRRTIGRLGAILGLLGALMVPAFAGPTGVFATTQDSCPGSDRVKLRLWENSKGDTSHGNDSLWVCSNVVDLGNIKFGGFPGSSCKGADFGDHWGICVSSVTIYTTSSLKWCFYSGDDYEHVFLQTTAGPMEGVRVNINSDWLMSARVRTPGSSC